MKKHNQRPKIENKFTNLLLAIRNFAASPLARRMVLSLFVIQAVLLVFTVRFGTPPDEANHVHFIKYYANNSVSPFFDEQTPTYNLGDKTREVDYLYHYAMSWLVRLLPFANNVELYIIRLMSVVVSLAALLIFARAFKLIGISAAVTTTALLLVTNLPMVLMMSSAINNDALVWLGMALGLWLLLRLWREAKLLDLLWLANLVVLGGLIKRTLLPICLAFGVVGLLAVLRHYRVFFAQLRRFDWRIAAAVLVLLVGLGLFTERIGGNVLTYGKVTPSCSDVQGKEACSVFWASLRAERLADTPREEQLAPIPFVIKWAHVNFKNVVDIQTQAWRHEVKPARWVVTVLGYALVIGLIYGIWHDAHRFKASKEARWRLYVFGIALFYVVIQLAVNYSGYLHNRIFGLALNGRYTLAGLIPLAALSCFYWSRLLVRRPRLQIILAIGVALIVILGSGLIMMLRNPQLYNG